MKTNRTIMIQGTGSGVGKSLITTALCRILYQDGFNVAPFKAINISLNSNVTKDGKEIATSQRVQAEACCIEPSVLMNPVLVKPQNGRHPQFILNGKVLQNYKNKKFWPVIKTNFDKIKFLYDVIVLEGSGSPTELGYISCDVANLKIAKYARSPIIVVADIDKGGAFASLVGTLSILKQYDPQSASQIRGFILNKYQGKRKYLEPSLKELTKITGIPILGVIPMIENHGITEEDIWNTDLIIPTKHNAVLDIAIMWTPTLQNSHDFDPLIQESGIQTRFVKSTKDFGTPDLVILAGTKSTISDLQWLTKNQLAEKILFHVSQGKSLIGICGGFQMLGFSIQDTFKIESNEKQVKGFGLLPINTIFQKTKTTKQTKLKVAENSGLLLGAENMEVSGYEIHMGISFQNNKRVDGIVNSESGWIIGTYLHDIFANDNFRHLILKNVARKKNIPFLPSKITTSDKYDSLAKVVRANINTDLLYQILNRKETYVSRI